LQQLDSVVQRSATSAEELASSAEQLSSQAEQQREAMSFFTLSKIKQSNSAAAESCDREVPSTNLMPVQVKRHDNKSTGEPFRDDI